MEYVVEISPRAWKDIRTFDRQLVKRIVNGIESMKDGLPGDVKRLKDFPIGYRLRIGTYRVLFDIEDNTIIIRRVKHRREAY